MSDRPGSMTDRQWSDLSGTFFLAFGVLFAFALYAPASWTGWLGRALSTVSMGLFGTLAYFLPPVLLVFALLYFTERIRKVKSTRVGALFSLFVLLSSVVACASRSYATLLPRLASDGEGTSGFQVIRMLWLDGRFPERIRPGNVWSGGLLGGLISGGLERVAGFTGAWILIAALILSVLVYAFGLSLPRRSKDREGALTDEDVPADASAGDDADASAEEAGPFPEETGERKGVFAFFKSLFRKKARAVVPGDGGNSDEDVAPPAHDLNARSYYTYTPVQPAPPEGDNGALYTRTGAPETGRDASGPGPQGWDTLRYDAPSPETAGAPGTAGPLSGGDAAYVGFPHPPQDHGINDPTRLRSVGGPGRPYLFNDPRTGHAAPLGDLSREGGFPGQTAFPPFSDVPGDGALKRGEPEPGAEGAPAQDRPGPEIRPPAIDALSGRDGDRHAIVRSPIPIRQEQVDGREEWVDRDAKTPHPGDAASKKKRRPRQMSLLSEYKTPPLSLLREDRGKVKSAAEERAIRKLGEKLEATLKEFGIDARVVHYTTGPTITRFELVPGVGVKVSRIVSLADDIALALAAYSVRIEAPIPGKSAIGIEIPNKNTRPVLLRSLLQSDAYKNAKGGLITALGCDVGGDPILCDLTRMPHLLIAGATGSGKSVCINAILISLLYRYGPEQVRMLMIDPKIVELSVYNSIPHLLHPVVTNPEKAYGVLNYAVQEMERRYRLLADARVRDITSYNEQKRQELKARAADKDEVDEDDLPLPYMLIVIDELADLMAVTQHQVEDAISRLMAKARAVGIHVIIATQRPSVDVVTGVIKANIPSRIAFAVASQVDSRTIIDTGGAEKLLGKGDMLYYPMGSIKAIRGQGSFVTNNEVERVLSFIKSYYPENYDRSVGAAIEDPDNAASGEGNLLGEGEDELLLDALRTVVETEYASVSLLQRKLQVGYPRAARLIDRLAELGYIGPFEGSKPREVLISQEAFEQLMNGRNGA